MVLGCSGSAGTPAPRHILFISLDTLRADYLNSYGYEDFETSPFLDAFARENLLFENAFISEPRTLTSHMSLFTGLYPQRHRVQDEIPLPSDISTLASLLRREGYRTQAFVDGGYMDARWGFDRGFDAYDVQPSGGLARIVPRARAWLEDHRDERFFLFLHTYDVHSKGPVPWYRAPDPYRGRFTGDLESALKTDDDERFRKAFDAKEGALDEDDKRYVRATYAEGVRFVDDELRRLFDALRELGLLESALIVIWSDHGEGLYDHEDWSHGELFEHTTRVPLLVRIPGYARSGRRVSFLVRSVDLMPTILELVRADVPDGLDGRSILGDLETGGDENRVAFSLRTKDDRRLFSVRSRNYRYIWDGNAEKSYLFDVREDPGEETNLSPSKLPEEAELRRVLSDFVEEYDRAWSRGVGESLPLDPAIEARLEALGYLQDRATTAAPSESAGEPADIP